MKTVCAFAPATIANVNVGYDVLGMSLGTIGDKVEVSFNDTITNNIVEIVNGDQLPTNVEKNCCSVVIKSMQQYLKDVRGVNIRIKKGFASGSGMGSSSASSAAAAFAYNRLIGEPFTLNELTWFAGEGERTACGTAHFDNVAPSLFGGINLIAPLPDPQVIQLPLKFDLYATVLFPKIEINTSDSREIMPSSIPTKIVTKQVATMGAFVSAMYTGNKVLLSKALVDLIAEPARKILIPKFDYMKSLALTLGALGFGISGSGPSVFALSSSLKSGENIADKLSAVYKKERIDVTSFVAKISSTNGAHITMFND